MAGLDDLLQERLTEADAWKAPVARLLGVELVVGPDVAFGEQVGDEDGSDAVVFADDDLEGREVVEKDLPAPAARGDNSPVAVAHGNDRVQLSECERRAPRPG